MRIRENRDTRDTRDTQENQERVRYDYRSQAFIGFTCNLADALKMIVENPSENYQIYECDQPVLDFRRNESVRYGFRRHYGISVVYRRTPDGEERLVKNPMESDEESEKKLVEIQRRRAEGIQRRIEQLKSKIESPVVV
jgi:hypothetical protein